MRQTIAVLIISQFCFLIGGATGAHAQPVRNTPDSVRHIRNAIEDSIRQHCVIEISRGQFESFVVSAQSLLKVDQWRDELSDKRKVKSLSAAVCLLAAKPNSTQREAISAAIVGLKLDHGVEVTGASKRLDWHYCQNTARTRIEALMLATADSATLAASVDELPVEKVGEVYALVQEPRRSVTALLTVVSSDATADPKLLAALIGLRACGPEAIRDQDIKIISRAALDASNDVAIAASNILFVFHIRNAKHDNINTYFEAINRYSKTDEPIDLIRFQFQSIEDQCRAIWELENMTDLGLPRDITISEFAKVKKLTKLKRLRVCSTLLNDDALTAIQELPLKSLSLGGCRSLTDRCINTIESMQDIRELDLADTAVTPASIEALGGLKHLRSLTLPYSFSDEHAEAILNHLSHLESLDLHWSAITETAVHAIEKAMTNCEIHHSP